MLPRTFQLVIHHTGQGAPPPVAAATPPALAAIPACHFWQRPASDPATGALYCSTMEMVKVNAPLLGPAAVAIGTYAITGSALLAGGATLLFGLPALFVVDMLINPGDAP